MYFVQNKDDRLKKISIVKIVFTKVLKDTDG